ncbi:hypothetical protein AMAG_07576 [Allomyces macrogynus ATCC 38327]|uniref:Uncharacterized protein n=1 Tax=Allomyces macrogynus (strain ATCC 38327) TaxID=578462 RepID=A0A0L0SIL4_ALLM3|nr:hypothetical protein AMAG_07576 [Allomyces macrogynus ATCC 38327]|eukprot:KNE62348.1 hypothetical protein AMAG_07576 [Allomyces macrogynus ATCC 38327]
MGHNETPGETLVAPAADTPNKPPTSPLFASARAFGAAAGSSPRPGSGIALQPLHAGSLVKNTLGLWVPLSPTVSRPVSPVLAAFHNVPGATQSRGLAASRPDPTIAVPAFPTVPYDQLPEEDGALVQLHPTRNAAMFIHALVLKLVTAYDPHLSAAMVDAVMTADLFVHARDESVLYVVRHVPAARGTPTPGDSARGLRLSGDDKQGAPQQADRAMDMYRAALHEVEAHQMRTAPVSPVTAVHHLHDPLAASSDQFAMAVANRLRDVQAAAAAAVARSAATTAVQHTTTSAAQQTATTTAQPTVTVTQPAVVVDHVPPLPPPPADTSSPRLRQAARHLSLQIPDSAVATTPTPAPSPEPPRDHDDDEDIYQEPHARPHPERYAAAATPTTAAAPTTPTTPVPAAIPAATSPTNDDDAASLASADSAESDDTDDLPRLLCTVILRPTLHALWLPSVGGTPTLLDPVAGMPITDIMTAAKDLQVWVRVTVLAMRQTPAVAGMLLQRAHRRASSALSVASSMRGLVGQKAMCCTPM